MPLGMWMSSECSVYMHPVETHALAEHELILSPLSSIKKGSNVFTNIGCTIYKNPIANILIITMLYGVNSKLIIPCFN